MKKRSAKAEGCRGREGNIIHVKSGRGDKISFPCCIVLSIMMSKILGNHSVQVEHFRRITLLLEAQLVSIHMC